jgi:hypothetical protein
MDIYTSSEFGAWRLPESVGFKLMLYKYRYPKIHHSSQSSVVLQTSRYRACIDEESILTSLF